MTFFLDGRLMTSRAQTHAYLKEVLALPEYYGNNLDALYDVLTERGESTRIILEHPEEMTENLGRYAQLMLTTFTHAALHNPNLEFSVEGDI